MSDNYGWSSMYARAVLENDESKVMKRVVQAENEILRRSLQPGIALREHRAMQIALDILKTIHWQKH